MRGQGKRSSSGDVGNSARVRRPRSSNQAKIAPNDIYTHHDIHCYFSKIVVPIVHRFNGDIIKSADRSTFINSPVPFDQNLSISSGETASDDNSISFDLINLSSSPRSPAGRQSPVTPLLSPHCGLDEALVLTLNENKLALEAKFMEESLFNQFNGKYSLGYSIDDRRSAVDFAIKLSFEEKISRSTIWPAIATFDAFIRHRVHTISRQQLVSTMFACILYHHKQQHNGSFPVRRMVGSRFPQLQKKEDLERFMKAVYNCEFSLIADQNFEPWNVPTIWHFYCDYQTMLNLSFLEVSMSSCIIERIFLDYLFLIRFPPSLIAVAAITLTQGMVRGMENANDFTAEYVSNSFLERFRNRGTFEEFHGIDERLAEYSKYKNEDIEPCVKAILAKFREDSIYSSMVFAKALVSKKREAVVNTSLAASPHDAPFSYSEFLNVLQEDTMQAAMSSVPYDRDHMRFFASIPAIFEELYLSARQAPVLSGDMWQDFVDYVNRQVEGTSMSFTRNGAMMRYPLVYTLLANHALAVEDPAFLINCYSSRPV